MVFALAQDERGRLGEGDSIGHNLDLVLLAIARSGGGEPDADLQLLRPARHVEGPGYFVLGTGEQTLLLAAHALELQLATLVVEHFHVGRAVELPVAQIHELALEHQPVALRGEERHRRHHHQLFLHHELRFGIARVQALVVRQHQHPESGQQVARRVADLRHTALLRADVRIESHELAEIRAAFEGGCFFLFLLDARGIRHDVVRHTLVHGRFFHHHAICGRIAHYPCVHHLLGRQGMPAVERRVDGRPAHRRVFPERTEVKRVATIAVGGHVEDRHQQFGAFRRPDGHLFLCSRRGLVAEGLDGDVEPHVAPTLELVLLSDDSSIVDTEDDHVDTAAPGRIVRNPELAQFVLQVHALVVENLCIVENLQLKVQVFFRRSQHELDLALRLHRIIEVPLLAGQFPVVGAHDDDLPAGAGLAAAVLGAGRYRIEAGRQRVKARRQRFVGHERALGHGSPLFIEERPVALEAEWRAVERRSLDRHFLYAVFVDDRAAAQRLPLRQIDVQVERNVANRHGNLAFVHFTLRVNGADTDVIAGLVEVLHVFRTGARVNRAFRRKQDLEVALVVGKGAAFTDLFVPGTPPARLGSHQAGAGDGVFNGAARHGKTGETLERAALADHVAEAEHIPHRLQRHIEVGPLVRFHADGLERTVALPDDVTPVLAALRQGEEAAGGTHVVGQELHLGHGVGRGAVLQRQFHLLVGQYFALRLRGFVADHLEIDGIAGLVEVAVGEDNRLGDLMAAAGAVVPLLVLQATDHRRIRVFSRFDAQEIMVLAVGGGLAGIDGREALSVKAAGQPGFQLQDAARILVVDVLENGEPALRDGLAGTEIGGIDFGTAATDAQGAHDIADVDALVAQLPAVRGCETDHIDAGRGEVHGRDALLADIILVPEARHLGYVQQGGVLLEELERGVSHVGQEHHILVHAIDPLLDLVDVTGAQGVFHTAGGGHGLVRRSAQRAGIHRCDEGLERFFVRSHALVPEERFRLPAQGQVVFAADNAARTAVHGFLMVLELPVEQHHDAGMFRVLDDICVETVRHHPAVDRHVRRKVGIGLFPVVLGEALVEAFGHDQLLQLIAGGDGLLLQFFQVAGSRLGLAFFLGLLDLGPEARIRGLCIHGTYNSGQQSDRPKQSFHGKLGFCQLKLTKNIPILPIFALISTTA